jgi:hypothetical protein
MFAESQQLVALAEAFIQQLEAQAGQLAAPTINVNFPVVTTPPVPGSVPGPPLQQVTWTVPTQPPPFNGSVDLSGITIPPFTGVAPSLSFGVAPAPFTGTVPDAPVTNLDFTYPTVAVTLPTPPPLMTLDTVNFPTITVPPFNANVPALIAVAPGPFNYTPGALYTSQLLTDLEEDLDLAITTGEYTYLNKQAQQALWDAGREREYRQQAAALAELNRMEVLGYAFPPGVFVDARIKIQTETNYTLAGLSRDIMTKQAELQLTNIVKARENATALEGQLIQYANQNAQRAFEAAKYATEAAIALYNAQVQAYTASLEAYKTQALVYDTQIKGLLAQIQITQAQIEYEKTKASINTSLVQQYATEVQAAEAVLQIYKTQVEIIQTQASVEKIKVDIYGAEIQAFVGKINAYTAEVEGYKASIEAQATIEQAYKTSVDAYTAEVNAGVAQINARVAVFHSQVEAFQAQLSGYDSAIKGMIGQAQAASLFNTATAEVFKAQVAAMQSYNQVLTSQWEAIMNEQAQITQIAVSAAKANGDLYISARGLSLDASKVGAQVCAQLGAAALGAISWHNSSQWSSNMQSSDSDNKNDNVSVNTNTSTSQSTSASTSNNVNQSNNTSFSSSVSTANSNTNSNSNVNSNSNTNSNSNSNSNVNSNTNANSNINSNTNANTNSSSNINSNTNANTNSNTNANTNSNSNINSNTNSNSNINSNTNANSNVNSEINSTSNNENHNFNTAE